jgi:hypothetical protein
VDEKPALSRAARATTKQPPMNTFFELPIPILFIDSLSYFLGLKNLPGDSR